MEACGNSPTWILGGVNLSACDRAAMWALLVVSVRGAGSTKEVFVRV